MDICNKCGAYDWGFWTSSIPIALWYLLLTL